MHRSRTRDILNSHYPKLLNRFQFLDATGDPIQERELGSLYEALLWR